MVCHSIHLPCSIFANLAARPGRVVGSVIPYENGNVADPNNVRRVARNPVVPPVTSNQSTHCNHLMPDCSCRQQHQNELEKDRVQYRSGHLLMEAKVVPEADGGMRSSPYYVSRGVPKADLADRSLQGSNLHGVATFNGMTAVAGGWRIQQSWSSSLWNYKSVLAY
jgi:hypothetical protein